MANESKDNEATDVADEWDLPSLISSVYITPIYQRGLEPINLPGFRDLSNDQPGILDSDGFVFPPSEHENLPIEPDFDEANSDDNCKEGSCDECCYVAHEDVDNISDEKLFVNGDLPSAIETTYPDSETPEAHAKVKKDHTTCNSDLPCDGWWKRKSTYIMNHIKGVTTVCSVVAAGAVVGFVIMGQRFQHDNWHIREIHFGVSSESMSRVIGLFSRLKVGFPGGQQIRSLLPTRLLSPQQLSA